jgi:hypothetical protein
VSLKKHGTAQRGLDGQDGGVEALQVAGLKDALAIAGFPDQVVGLREAGGEGLFDKQIEARIEQGGGDGMMMNGGNGHAGRVEMKIGGEQFAD